MYIAPSGAVQFALNIRPLQPIWVNTKPVPLHTRMPNCPCTHGFLVVHSEYFEIGAVPADATPAVCLCQGNFIE